MFFFPLEDEGLIVAKQRMSKARVLRLNFSEVYQYLNAESILHEMVGRKLITSQQKEYAESCNSKYAQNISAAVALLDGRVPPTVLYDMCDILEATDSPEQSKLAMKLRSGRVFPPHR